MGSLGAAVWGIALICAPETSARSEDASCCDGCGIVRTSLISLLASLGLNTHPRGKGGQGCETARRRIVPRGSCEILRSSVIDMKLKLGPSLDRQAT